ncbi:hypothetical protein SeMB42_g02987 [Synchytrium endobioticum]|uniref:3'-5' exonuclease domain-containing protein n=1 Tax=Synchytrium endobioticum TaxID=286115 RepID=A0A507DCD3_9FUNG|nr:hypothetical protein SeMB42_g02987 [Synchytrium endobioticum]
MHTMFVLPALRQSHRNGQGNPRYFPVREESHPSVLSSTSTSTSNITSNASDINDTNTPDSLLTSSGSVAVANYAFAPNSAQSTNLTSQTSPADDVDESARGEAEVISANANIIELSSKSATSLSAVVSAMDEPNSTSSLSASKPPSESLELSTVESPAITTEAVSAKHVTQSTSSSNLAFVSPGSTSRPLESPLLDPSEHASPSVAVLPDAEDHFRVQLLPSPKVSETPRNRRKRRRLQSAVSNSTTATTNNEGDNSESADTASTEDLNTMPMQSATELAKFMRNESVWRKEFKKTFSALSVKVDRLESKHAVIGDELKKALSLLEKSIKEQQQVASNVSTSSKTLLSNIKEVNRNVGTLDMEIAGVVKEAKSKSNNLDDRSKSQSAAGGPSKASTAKIDSLADAFSALSSDLTQLKQQSQMMADSLMALETSMHLKKPIAYSESVMVKRVAEPYPKRIVKTASERVRNQLLAWKYSPTVPVAPHGRITFGEAIGYACRVVGHAVSQPIIGAYLCLADAALSKMVSWTNTPNPPDYTKELVGIFSGLGFKPPITTPTVYVIDNADDAQKILDAFLSWNDAVGARDQKKIPTVGFDCETAGKHSESSDAPSSGPPSLVQFALTPELASMIGTSIVKVGVSAIQDAQKISDAYECRFSNVVELYLLAAAKGIRRRSLADLYSAYCGVVLDKKNRLGAHTWDSSPLPAGAIRYAAMDAIAGLRIFLQMTRNPEHLLAEINPSKTKKTIDGAYEVCEKHKEEASDSSVRRKKVTELDREKEDGAYEELVEDIITAVIRRFSERTAGFECFKSTTTLAAQLEKLISSIDGRSALPEIDLNIIASRLMNLGVYVKINSKLVLDEARAKELASLRGHERALC